jgi:hypothetical protein
MPGRPAANHLEMIFAFKTGHSNEKPGLPEAGLIANII